MQHGYESDRVLLLNKQYEEEGYAIVPGFLNDVQVDSLVNEMEKVKL